MFDCDRYHFLFSTTTRFARNIDNDYYGEKHYVWTALHFNQLQEEFNVRGQAASSDPMTIATRFIQDVATRDEHCDRIYAHISAVERGANEMLINNKIDEKTKKCVDARICTAVNTDFLPLVYVIDTRKVGEARIHLVEKEDVARKDTPEYKIYDLKEDECELIDLSAIIESLGPIKRVVLKYDGKA